MLTKELCVIFLQITIILNFFYFFFLSYIQYTAKILYFISIVAVCQIARFSARSKTHAINIYISLDYCSTSIGYFC